MSDQGSAENRAAPEVMLVRGGVSAHIGAIVVAGMLVAVVWIGMSGRSAPPAPRSAPPVAAQSSKAATPELQPTPIAAPAAGPAVSRPNDVFGVYAKLGDSQFITILAEPEPGLLTGRLRVPIPPPATRGTFVFQQFSAPSAPGQPVHVAHWPLRVEMLVAASRRESVVVDATVPARRTKVNAPRPVQRGFRLTVRAQSGVASGELLIEVQIGPNRQLVGDDGIFGWPVVTQLASTPTR